MRRIALPLTADYFHRCTTLGHGGFQHTCKLCKAIFTARYVRPDPQKKNLAEKIRQQRDRMAALMHYSGGDPACACCGERAREFLAIDHIAGHRLQKGHHGSGLHRWLRIQGYPVGFRVLCHNCNQSIAWYGYCPHQAVDEEAM